MDLLDLRSRIDNIDAQLVEIFLQRMELCRQIALVKKQIEIPVHSSSREDEVLRSVQSQAGPEMAGYALQLYATLFELSKEYQKRIIDSEVK